MAAVEVLCVCVPVIVLCQSESLLMQRSSCYCDSLSHSRSGRTISAQPAAAALSQSLHNMHTQTHIHTYTHCTGSGSPCLKAAGEIRSDGVCVCGSHLVYVWDGRGERDGSALSSLHSSALMEGYVKRQTCCRGLQPQQEPIEGCTLVSRRSSVTGFLSEKLSS